MKRLIKWLTAREKNNPYISNLGTMLLLGFAIGGVFGTLITVYLMNL